MIHKKLLSLLVLLMTAASGAWAAELTVSDGTDKISELPIDATSSNLYQKNEMVYPATALTAMTGQYITAVQFYANKENISLDGQYTVRMKEVSTFGIMNGIEGHPYHTDNTEDMVSKIVYEGELSVAESKLTVTFTTPYVYNGGNLVIAFYTKTPGSSAGSSLKFYGEDYGIDHCIGVSRAAENSLEEIYRGTGLATLPKATFTYTYVEMNDDMTEAKFTMPASDATVDYELVRDMGVSMPVTVGDGTDGADYRVRLKKDGSKWALADLTILQLFAVIKVHDAIENKDLAFFGDGAVCSLGLYALDDQDKPTGAAISDYTTLVPGRYAVIAKAVDGSAYDGQTAQSNAIVLFQGYEVTVPSKEYVTYYKDEPLYADATTSSDAVLYTISSVSGDKAVLSSAITTAPSNTPLLIYNPTDVTKKFLLIPAEAEPTEVPTVYDGFTGTLSDATIPASTSTKNNYALNGKQFVWVKNAISIGANKAYLSVTTGGQLHAPAPALNIVFDDNNMTAIDSMVNGQSSMDNGDWYDLNGRKVANGQSSMVNGQLKKGIYINNGRKVVIK